MDFNIPYKNISVRYRLSGEGKTLVLLHGYLESIDVWGSFETELSKDFRVLSIDLLGHGKTECLSDTYTMRDQAELVEYIVNVLKIKQFHLLGHSMGGYVALQYIHSFPKKVLSLILLHSHAGSDSEDKKYDRQRTIELIKHGKKLMVTSQHAAKLFATENIPYFVNEIERIKKMAAEISEQGVIADLNGMKERVNYIDELKDFSFPVLYLVGKKDKFIPYSVSESYFNLSENIKPCILEKSGHVSFIEEKEKCLACVKDFLNTIENN